MGSDRRMFCHTRSSAFFQQRPSAVLLTTQRLPVILVPARPVI
jgi:hypothetical protein